MNAQASLSECNHTYVASETYSSWLCPPQQAHQAFFSILTQPPWITSCQKGKEKDNSDAQKQADYGHNILDGRFWWYYVNDIAEKGEQEGGDDEIEGEASAGSHPVSAF